MVLVAFCWCGCVAAVVMAEDFCWELGVAVWRGWEEEEVGGSLVEAGVESWEED